MTPADNAHSVKLSDALRAMANGNRRGVVIADKEHPQAALMLAAADALDDPQPEPRIWPVCSACGVPYVLRQSWAFGDSAITSRWLWQRDCAKPKSGPCKGAAAEVHDANGEVPQPVEAEA